MRVIVNSAQKKLRIKINLALKRLVATPPQHTAHTQHIDYHKTCFDAVTVITQLGIENKEPLYPVTFVTMLSHLLH